MDIAGVCAVLPRRYWYPRGLDVEQKVRRHPLTGAADEIDLSAPTGVSQYTAAVRRPWHRRDTHQSPPSRQ